MLTSCMVNPIWIICKVKNGKVIWMATCHKNPHNLMGIISQLIWNLLFIILNSNHNWLLHCCWKPQNIMSFEVYILYKLQNIYFWNIYILQIAYATQLTRLQAGRSAPSSRDKGLDQGAERPACNPVCWLLNPARCTTEEDVFYWNRQNSNAFFGLMAVV